MNWRDASLAIILVVSVISAMFAGGRAASVYLNTYKLENSECRYDYAPRPVPGDTTVLQEPDSNQECVIDYNAADRDIVEGVVMFFFSALPILFTSWLLFFKRRGSS